jgi:hypothetical protein
MAVIDARSWKTRRRSATPTFFQGIDAPRAGGGEVTGLKEDNDITPQVVPKDPRWSGLGRRHAVGYKKQTATRSTGALCPRNLRLHDDARPTPRHRAATPISISAWAASPTLTAPYKCAYKWTPPTRALAPLLTPDDASQGARRTDLGRQAKRDPTPAT